MGVNMLHTKCTLKPHGILKVKYKPHFNAVCTKQVSMFVSLDSYDSKIQSLSIFSSNSHIAHYSSLTSNQSCNVVRFAGSPFKSSSCSLSPIYQPHSKPQLRQNNVINICNLAQCIMNFPVMLLVRSKMIGGWASVSGGGVQDIANSYSCSSSYMPPQSNAELIILNGPLPASSVSSPLFPLFYIAF